MAPQHFQTGSGRPNNNRSPHGQNNSNESKRDKTFEELATEVAKSVFKDNFEDILQMSKTTQLDSLLTSIEIFAGCPEKESQKKQLGAYVTTSQLRNVYDKVKKIKGDYAVNALKMIRPNLAYIAGREKGEEVQKFLAFLDLLIKTVETDKQVKEFQTFFEAVVAYHKLYGKNN